MGLYKGLRSTDAEIVLDFKRGQAIFDYSLNKFQQGDSNTSCSLSREGNKYIFFLDTVRNIYYGFWIVLIFLGNQILAVIQSVFIIMPKEQYTWQRLLKKWGQFAYGTQEESIIGKQESSQLKFFLKKNIWFDYYLDGDYHDKIQKMSLLRRFIKKQHLGITSHHQEGWELIFSFESPPQHGYVSVRSLL